MTRSPALFRGGLPAERGPRGSPPLSPLRLPPPAPLPPPARGSESAAGVPTAGSRPLPASAAGSAGCRVPRAGSSQLRWAPRASPPPSPGTWRLQLGACTALCDRLGTGCCSPLGSRCRSVARVWPRSPPCSLTRQELAGAQAAEPRPRALGEPVPGAGGSHLRVQRVRPALCPPPTDATSVRRGPEAPTPQMQKLRLQVVGGGQGLSPRPRPWDPSVLVVACVHPQVRTSAPCFPVLETGLHLCVPTGRPAPRGAGVQPPPVPAAAPPRRPPRAAGPRAAPCHGPWLPVRCAAWTTCGGPRLGLPRALVPAGLTRPGLHRPADRQTDGRAAGRRAVGHAPASYRRGRPPESHALAEHPQAPDGRG